MAQVDYGSHEAEINGETYELKVTLLAMKKINQQFGSLRSALTEVQGMNFDAIAFIIATGAGLTGKQKREEVEENVLAEGVANSMMACIDYVMLLFDPTGKSAGDGEGKD